LTKRKPAANTVIPARASKMKWFPGDDDGEDDRERRKVRIR
jgi:hypothetical protein